MLRRKGRTGPYSTSPGAQKSTSSHAENQVFGSTLISQVVMNIDDKVKSIADKNAAADLLTSAKLLYHFQKEQFNLDL